MHAFSVLSSHIESLVAQGGYVFLFIVTTLEGLPLVGMLVPGHVSIIIGGFLARIGTLQLTWVIILSVAGAILGDFTGFMIGRRYGMSFIDRLSPYFFIRATHIEKTRSLLARHTGKAMMIGRFSPVTRALMPFIVGASHTSSARFWFFNILGGVTWAISSIMLGYLFGEGYHATAGIFGKGVLVAILLAFLIVWGYRFVNMRFHIFAKYELFVLGLNVISLWVLAKTFQDALSVNSFMVNFDVWANLFMERHITPVLVWIAQAISVLGGTWMVAFAGIGLALFYLMHHRLRSAAIVIVSLGLSGFLIGVLKEFFLRVRPDNAFIHTLTDPSFPSGHATMAAAFFVVLAYLVAPKIRGWIKRDIFLVVMGLCIILVGLSRVMLNVHWVSDVVAGWSLGIFIATGTILLVKYIGVLFIRDHARLA